MKHVTNRIQAYISGELDSDRMAAFEEHLNECPSCRKEADRAREIWEMLEAAETPSPATGSVWSAVQARTFGRGTSEREWFFGAGNMTRAGLATAAVAAGLMLGVLLPAGSGYRQEADSGLTDSSWLVESSWLSESSWLGGDGSTGLDDILLGADLLDEGNGS
ncbi:MAG: zf-HC2 domain-containing protein [Candidatus Krumholzibacteria bacterium]|nr:zf-HC2 domain-containing protein [Candidatus Krumholzibacteria bacterium]